VLFGETLSRLGLGGHRLDEGVEFEVLLAPELGNELVGDREIERDPGLKDLPKGLEVRRGIEAGAEDEAIDERGEGEVADVRAVAVAVLHDVEAGKGPQDRKSVV